MSVVTNIVPPLVIKEQVELTYNIVREIIAAHVRKDTGRQPYMGAITFAEGAVIVRLQPAVDAPKATILQLPGVRA